MNSDLREDVLSLKEMHYDLEYRIKMRVKSYLDTLIPDMRWYPSDGDLLTWSGHFDFDDNLLWTYGCIYYFHENDFTIMNGTAHPLFKLNEKQLKTEFKKLIKLAAFK